MAEVVITQNTTHSYLGDPYRIKGECKTNPTPIGGGGQDCTSYGDPRACYDLPGYQKLNQSTLRKQWSGEGVHLHCDVFFSDYQRTPWGRDIVEPGKICVYIYASSPSGAADAGYSGHIQCTVAVDYFDIVVPDNK